MQQQQSYAEISSFKGDNKSDLKKAKNIREVSVVCIQKAGLSDLISLELSNIPKSEWMVWARLKLFAENVMPDFFLVYSRSRRIVTFYIEKRVFRCKSSLFSLPRIWRNVTRFHFSVSSSLNNEGISSRTTRSAAELLNFRRDFLNPLGKAPLQSLL